MADDARCSSHYGNPVRMSWRCRKSCLPCSRHVHAGRLRAGDAMRFLGCRSTSWRSVAVVGLAGGCAAAFGPVAGASAAAPCGSAGTLSSSGATATCTYTGAGQDTFTVPAGVTSLKVTAVGAAGGGGGLALGAPGSGASVQDSAVPVSRKSGVDRGGRRDGWRRRKRCRWGRGKPRWRRRRRRLGPAGQLVLGRRRGWRLLGLA